MLNLTEGGRNARMSAEQKEKIRQALRGFTKTPEHRANISKSKKGIPKPESVKQSLREKMKGRAATWLKGKTLSPEHVEKIRRTSKGRRHSEQFKQSVSKRNVQNYHLIHSEESRRTRSEKLKGRKLSAERRENMRLAQLRRWQHVREASL